MSQSQSFLPGYTRFLVGFVGSIGAREDKGPGDVRPHGPDPGCARIEALLVPAASVDRKKILRQHREKNGLPDHAEVMAKAKEAKVSNTAKVPRKGKDQVKKSQVKAKGKTQVKAKGKEKTEPMEE